MECGIAFEYDVTSNFCRFTWKCFLSLFTDFDRWLYFMLVAQSGVYLTSHCWILKELGRVKDL